MRSLVKALRDVGIVVGSISATAGLLALQNPEVLVPIAALGPYGALAVIVVPIVAKTLQDKFKHSKPSA